MSLTLLRNGADRSKKSVEIKVGRKTLKNYSCRFADRKNKAFFILSGKADSIIMERTSKRLKREKRGSDLPIKLKAETTHNVKTAFHNKAKRLFAACKTPAVMPFSEAEKEIAAMKGATGKMKTVFQIRKAVFLLLKERNKFKNQAL